MSSHEYTGQPTFSGALHKINKEVTRAGQKLRSDDTIRGFLDKAHGAVAFDPIKKAVVKATSLEHGPPKEKHVQFLMHEMRDGNVKEIFNELFNRLHNKDATTVLKSLMVFHRLFNGCPTNYKLLERVYVSRGEFRLSRFLDEDTHESMQVRRRLTRNGPHQASRMVQQYALYMEEKIEMHHDVRFQYERSTEDAARHVAEISPEQLMQDVKSLMSLLDVGYKCSFREVSAAHPTSIAAFSLIFKDMRILYHALNKGVLRLLENYFEMPKMVASKILVLYKSFLEHAKKVSKMFDDAHELLGQDRIDLNPPPESFLEALEAYLDQDDYTPSAQVRQSSDDVQNVPVIQLADLIGDVGAQQGGQGAPTLKPTQDFMDSLFGDAPAGAAPARPPPPPPAPAAPASVDDLFGGGAAPAAPAAGGGDLLGLSGPAGGGNPFAAAPASASPGMGLGMGAGGMGGGMQAQSMMPMQGLGGGGMGMGGMGGMGMGGMSMGMGGMGGMGGGMQAQSMMPMQGLGGGGGMMGGMMGGSMMQGGMQAQSMMPMGGGMGMSGMQMGGGVTPLSPEQAKSHRPRIGPSPGSQAAAPAQPAAEPDMDGLGALVGGMMSSAKAKPKV